MHAVPGGEVHRHDVLVDAVLVERGRVVVQHVEAAVRRTVSATIAATASASATSITCTRGAPPAASISATTSAAAGFGDVGDGHRARLPPRAAARWPARCPIRRR